MASTQTQNETATQLFARLVNSEKNTSAIPLSKFSTTDTNTTESKIKKTTDKLIVQLENDLMLKKTLNLDGKLLFKELCDK